MHYPAGYWVTSERMENASQAVCLVEMSMAQLFIGALTPLFSGINSPTVPRQLACM